MRRILHYCAVDSGAAIEVQTRTLPGLEKAEFELLVTARELVEEHQVWCLACRVACFCPQAKVAVLVQSECRQAS